MTPPVRSDAMRDEAPEHFVYVLGEIARGRCDNDRPLAAETSRQMARHVLSLYNVEWPKGKARGDSQ